MIHFNMPRETLKYLGGGAIIMGLWLVAYIIGARNGVKAAKRQYEAKHAESVIELDQVHQDLVSTQIKLTECEARAAGDCALDCESITQERVSQALASCAAICRD